MDTPNNKQDFIRTIVTNALANNTHEGRVVTRFPPEPNGYLHIGHAKSICLNFGIAQEFEGGVCHLRFDDTNPSKESTEYVDSIQSDVRWLGFDWNGKLFFASNYFEQLYGFAVQLIKDGKAYVCDLSEEEIREYRGSLSELGRPSPYRERSVEENLDLFARMRAGEFEDGVRVLRGKIDMSNANMLMRDPLFYRIRHVHHHRTGNDWCIYPMYDFAHCLSDAVECITHSICTLEFENNRELYDWILDALAEHIPVKGERPHQYEFARLSLAYTVMSKRFLLKMVEDGMVSGWDDPRMPTVAGMRRRGYTPEAIRAFCEMIGVAKANSVVDFQKLEFCVRDDLNHRAPRVMAVFNPLKVTITNFPEGEERWIDAASFPHDIGKEGSRKVPFSREIYIDRADFQQHPEKKFFRLAPGREIRLRYACFITCDEVVVDPESGEVTELRCSWDPESWGGSTPDGRKVKATLHWVSASHAKPAEVRLYERLFKSEQPGANGGALVDDINSNSLETIQAWIEPSVVDDKPGARYQFERKGYFIGDAVDSSSDNLVFNRIVGLRDTWAKLSSSPTPKATATVTKSKVEAKSDERKRPPKLTAAQVRVKIRASTPELAERFERYQSTLGLSEEEADLLTGDLLLAAFFEDALAVHKSASEVAKWVINEIRREIKEVAVDALLFDGAQFGRLVALVEDGTLTASSGKKVFAQMVESGQEPAAIVIALGLDNVADTSELAAAIDTIIAAFPDKVAAYKGGKKALFGFFMGQAMRKAAGADGSVVRGLLQERLDA